ncbi:aspartate kinase [Candidatus Peregrinibacteria bacterium]|nr:aspartate kinase [Candidatus Peregrinibacteria bacterium]
MNTRVLKFGGTSMGSPESLNLVADIIESGPDRQTAVVSATSGTTNQLQELAQSTLNGDGEIIMAELIDRHLDLLQELDLDLDLSELFDGIEYVRTRINEALELSPEILDLLTGFGERISSRILASLLNERGIRAEMLDAYDFIYTDNNFGAGNVDFERSNPAIRQRVGEMLDEGVVPIVTGFIGRAENGAYVTLGRGGSDYSAAIITAALDAEELQIWTDVDGIYNANPALIPEARPLESVSFGEAAELGYFGAKVLHPKTVIPAREKGIPLRVLNTFNPEAPGTLVHDNEKDRNSIKSVAYKENVTILNICSARMLNSHGFLARLFEIFARYEIVVDVVSTSEVCVSLTLCNGIPPGLLEELEEFSNVSVQTDMAILCLVGDGISSNTEVLGRLFSNLSGHEISMVSQGASMRNITFIVNGDEVCLIVRKVFNSFFNSI